MTTGNEDFATISTFKIWRGCGTLVGTALNLGEKMKTYPEVLTLFINLKFGYFKLLGSLRNDNADGNDNATKQ